MMELGLMEIIKNTVKAMLASKVIVLFGLEIIVLLISLVFSKLMNKKLVYKVSIGTSIILGAFYISNYINTLKIFIDNVSTKLIELIYFPTTLEFMVIMLVSIAIMVITLTRKNTKKFVKYVNTIIPLSISFIFLSIIEYINTNNLSFNEFSVFTNESLMSLFELGTSMFVVWLASLFIYKIDLIVINNLKNRKSSDELIELPKLKYDLDIELPRLKTEM